MGKRKVLVYTAFVVITVLSLTLKRPTPDFITIDFVSLAGGYGGILVGLGGFSITVLAVLLGLDALDAGEDRTAAHIAAVRHVAISLAIASITCFVGASLMSEVGALGNSMNARKNEFQNNVRLQLRAAGIPEKKIAAASVAMAGTANAGFEPDRDYLKRIEAVVGPATREILGPSAQEMDRLLGGSIRRHFLLASVPMFLASFLLLQSLSFLMLIRFPRSDRLHGLQALGVLGVGGLLLIKLLHAVSYGQPAGEFYFSRIAMAAVLVIVVVIYAPRIQTSALAAGGIQAYMPLSPYYVCLASSIVSMFLLAATFSNYGPPSLTDRAVVGIGVVLSTAFMLAMQLEQPTIELLRREETHPIG
jgi:hypothetical protein